MSQENVEIGRAATEAFRRGDWEAVAATFDPHILYRTDASWPEQRVYGREAVIAFLQDVREAYGPQTEIEEAVDLGDRLLVRLHYIVHAPASGIDGDLRYSEIVTYRQGRAILVEFFLEHEQALKAVGLKD